MRFADIIGNDDLKKLLMQVVDEGRLPHAVLLTEDAPWGGIQFAIALAQYVNCSNHEGGDSCGECGSCHKFGKLIHPDLHFVFPVSATKSLSEAEKKAPISEYFAAEWQKLVLEKPFFSEQDLYDAIGVEGKSGNISVHEAKRIIEKLSLKSFEAEYKSVIIYLPEKMNQEASNKLLKLIEEPPAGTLFILVSQAPEKIISTIRSRCQLIRLKPLTAQERRDAHLEAEFNEEFNELIARLMEVSLRKSVIDTFPVWECVSGYGRERQKEWCLYFEKYVRKIYMVASSLESLAEIDPREEKDIRTWAAGVKPTFFEKAFSALESSISAIESNVNAKLLFCNLCNSILLSV